MICNESFMRLFELRLLLIIIRYFLVLFLIFIVFFIGVNVLLQFLVVILVRTYWQDLAIMLEWSLAQFLVVFSFELLPVEFATVAVGSPCRAGLLDVDPLVGRNTGLLGLQVSEVVDDLFRSQVFLTLFVYEVALHVPMWVWLVVLRDLWMLDLLRQGHAPVEVVFSFVIGAFVRVQVTFGLDFFILKLRFLLAKTVENVVLVLTHRALFGLLPRVVLGKCVLELHPVFKRLVAFHVLQVLMFIFDFVQPFFNVVKWLLDQVGQSYDLVLDVHNVFTCVSISVPVTWLYNIFIQIPQFVLKSLDFFLLFVHFIPHKVFRVTILFSVQFHPDKFNFFIDWFIAFGLLADGLQFGLYVDDARLVFTKHCLELVRWEYIGDFCWPCHDFLTNTLGTVLVFGRVLGQHHCVLDLLDLFISFVENPHKLVGKSVHLQFLLRSFITYFLFQSVKLL